MAPVTVSQETLNEALRKTQEDMKEHMKEMMEQMVEQMTALTAKQLQPLTQQLGDMQTKINGKLFSLQAEVSSDILDRINGVKSTMPPDPGGPPPPSSSPRVSPVPFDNIDPLRQNDKTTSYFRADDVGYFDPHMVGDGDMFTQGKEVWFKDVYLFTERVRDVAQIKGEDVLKTNIPACLRGTALAWYTTELSNLERQGLRAGTLETFLTELTLRFQEAQDVALRKLTAEKFTAYQVRQERQPAEYVYTIIRHAKSALITSPSQQLTFAWNGIAPELRIHIPRPTATTTVTGFIADLEAKKDTWFQLLQRQYQGQDNQQRFYGNPQSQDARNGQPSQRQHQGQDNQQRFYGNARYSQPSTKPTKPWERPHEPHPPRPLVPIQQFNKAIANNAEAEEEDFFGDRREPCFFSPADNYWVDSKGEEIVDWNSASYFACYDNTANRTVPRR
jgi:hypothetical protein